MSWSSLLDGKHHHHRLLAECARQQREADAALVEAVGCLCSWNGTLTDAEWEKIHPFDLYPSRVIRHDPRCPLALAAAIRKGEER